MGIKLMILKWISQNTYPNYIIIHKFSNQKTSLSNQFTKFAVINYRH